MTRTTRAALVVALALLGGCASLPETVRALAKDNASVCIMLDATLYGRVTICRSNAGAAELTADGAVMNVKHRAQ